MMLSPKHCLLIEDRADDALLIRKEIEKLPNFKMQWVMDGEEAVEYLQRKPPFTDSPSPNVILLDLKLPRMDGFAFLEWHRLHSADPAKRAPVMVVSISPLPEDMQRAHNLGAAAYVTKPLDSTQFRQQLSQIAALAATPPEPPTSTPAARRVTCTLILPNGRKLIASAAANLPGEIVPFDYSGDTSILRPFTDKGTLGFFRWYLQGCAANSGSQIEVSIE